MTINAHILTDLPTIYFTRQTPGGLDYWEGVKFSYGLKVPQEMDVLIIYNKSCWTVKTKLPLNRLAYVSGDPEDYIKHSPNFLNQFSLVVVSGEHNLKTTRLNESIALPWFVGLEFLYPLIPNPEKTIFFDEMINWEVPEKDDRISIVTSNLSFLPYHKVRLNLVNHLKKTIPDRIEFYGWGHNKINDKKDALLPHKFHLALENNIQTWGCSEKLTDPLLCYSLPIYVGAPNADSVIFSDAFVKIDPFDLDGAVKTIISTVESDEWSKRLEAIKEARNQILYHNNIMSVFARIAKRLMAQPVAGPMVTIRSEKSFPPSEISNHSYWKFIGRRIIQLFNPEWELRRHKSSYIPELQNQRYRGKHTREIRK